jgi:sigma-B regulation protein RsbU (phosphoserine phosphatase)
MGNKGIAGKMIRYFVAFALATGLIFLALFGYHLIELHNMTVSEEKEQLELLSERSVKAMTDITEENLESLNASAIERTNDEFRIARQDLISLRSQVEDVFRNPENYKAKEIDPPKKDRSDVPQLVLLSPYGYENISPETLEMIQKMANLEPMMKEIVLSEDYVIDSYISTMDGVTLAFDRQADERIDENGNIRDFDARECVWFDGALNKGDVFFASGEKSSLYENSEVVYSIPVYVDDKAVAVIEGCMHMKGMSNFMKDRDIGESGFMTLVTNEGQLLYSSREEGELKIDKDNSMDIRNSLNPALKAVIDKGLSGETGVEKIKVDGEDCYAAYGIISECGWTQVIFAAVDEVMEAADNLHMGMQEYSKGMIAEESRTYYTAAGFAVVIFIIILIFANVFVSRRTKKITEPLTKMIDSLNEFNGVNMFFEVQDEYRTGDEIQVLAESFESLAGKMRDYVDEIVEEMSTKSRVKAELDLAARIQADMLPNIFPAFPDRPEFNIYATMTPAKEVGGDFYDFFLVGEDHLALVMADVSGKGVPAAMFMMMAKSMLQSQLISGKDPARVLQDVNKLIFADNKENMFVTVWVGILDIKTGVLVASNGGHEYPIFREPGGAFEIIKDKHGFVIGGRKNMKYTNYEMVMKPGSRLFLYTDGVPEAANMDRKRFGMERTLAAVNIAPDASVEEILANVDSEVKKFAGEAEQFDDLTMLCLEYLGTVTE